MQRQPLRLIELITCVMSSYTPSSHVPLDESPPVSPQLGCPPSSDELNLWHIPVRDGVADCHAPPGWSCHRTDTPPLLTATLALQLELGKVVVVSANFVVPAIQSPACKHTQRPLGTGNNRWCISQSSATRSPIQNRKYHLE